MAAPSYD